MYTQRIRCVCNSFFFFFNFLTRISTVKANVRNSYTYEPIINSIFCNIIIVFQSKCITKLLGVSREKFTFIIIISRIVDTRRSYSSGPRTNLISITVSVDCVGLKDTYDRSVITTILNSCAIHEQIPRIRVAKEASGERRKEIYAVWYNVRRGTREKWIPFLFMRAYTYL